MIIGIPSKEIKKPMSLEIGNNDGFKKAFENTRLKKGLSFIEIVSNCNSGWKMTPNESNIWMEEHMFPYFPLGDIKVKGKEDVITIYAAVPSS